MLEARLSQEYEDGQSSDLDTESESQGGIDQALLDRVREKSRGRKTEEAVETTPPPARLGPMAVGTLFRNRPEPVELPPLEGGISLTEAQARWDNGESVRFQEAVPLGQMPREYWWRADGSLRFGDGDGPQGPRPDFVMPFSEEALGEDF